MSKLSVCYTHIAVAFSMIILGAKTNVHSRTFLIYLCFNPLTLYLYRYRLIIRILMIDSFTILCISY